MNNEMPDEIYVDKKCENIADYTFSDDEKNKHFIRYIRADRAPAPKAAEDEPSAYWARFNDGSGSIFENKDHAENYADRSFAKCTVIPVYTRAQPQVAGGDDGYLNQLGVISRAFEKLEAIKQPDAANVALSVAEALDKILVALGVDDLNINSRGLFEGYIRAALQTPASDGVLDDADKQKALGILNAKSVPDDIQALIHKHGYPKNPYVSALEKIACALAHGWSLDQIREEIEQLFREYLRASTVSNVIGNRGTTYDINEE